MKNKFFIILLSFFLNSELYSENIFIEAKNITLDKEKKTTIFKDNVTVKTIDKKITSQYANYNKDTQEIILKDKITAVDNLNNIINTNHAEYNNIKNIFKTIGLTTLITSENYELEGADIYLDNENKIIKSNKKAILTDVNGNKIFLDNFEYVAKENIFKSVGYIKIIDNLENTYEFSQIYINTKNKEILGTDIKAFLNHNDFKLNTKNDPRVFSNSMMLEKGKRVFNKSVFTLCELQDGEKCPPWTLQANKMTHDNKSKTIYYDKAVIKVYDIPIFYLPKLSLFQLK